MSDRTTPLFDRIAPRYDLLNRLLSAGTDRLWRRRAAALLHLKPLADVLDVGAGTGDMAQAVAGRLASGFPILLDPSREMLKIAGARYPQAICVEGDGQQLPFENNRFDALTIAFGLRNISRPERFLAEACRVLRPGGELLILEFGNGGASIPGRFFRAFLRFWIPLAGRLFGGDMAAYRYLMDSMDRFAREFNTAATCEQAGLKCRLHEHWLLGLLDVTLVVKT